MWLDLEWRHYSECMLAQNVENCLALGKTTYFCTTVYMFIADALTLYAVKLQFRTHTHTRSTALFPELPGWAGTRKGKPIWIILKQETMSGSCISWAICKSAPRFRQITTPAPHHSVLQARCLSCRQANSVKALTENVQLNADKYTKFV